MSNETPIRSMAKAVSWRILATLTTVLLVFAFTGSIDLAFTVGVFEMLAKLLLYFGRHLRMRCQTPKRRSTRARLEPPEFRATG